MRRTAVIVLACLVLVGCCADGSTRAGLLAAPAQAAAVPCPAGCQPTAQVAMLATGPVLLANTGTYQLAAPVGVEYRVGPNENIRAAISVPANVAACVTDGAAKGLLLVGDTLRCISANLWPNPVPTQRLLYAQPAAAPAAAPPCAPAYAAPTPKAAPCPPPVAVIQPMPMPPRVCEGDGCEVPTSVASR